MGLAFENAAGQTPLDDDEKEGLLIGSISTMAELNEAEQLNIQQAVEWTLRRKLKAKEILTEKFVRDLHKRMYGDVWKWAGTFRHTNKNIGVDKIMIAVDLKQLLDNAGFWIEKQTFPPDEIAIRVKYGIVSIHCFPNGNGRHSRLLGDVIASHIFKLPVFPWGHGDRKKYLQSLREADHGNLNPLIAFARSTPVQR
jgi:Fic-DOC domain mobile mystery protein B